MEQYPDNHYCGTCKYFNRPVTEKHCNDCLYDGIRGFSGWKPIQMQYDVVSKPKHYILMEGLEVRDVLAALVAKITKASINKVPGNYMFESDYVQMMQYLMRFMDKNGKQDLEKAKWYLDKLIDAYE